MNVERKEEDPVVIVGGGLAGLACAVKLTERGIPWELHESEKRVGGRVRTDHVKGFRLDRGFQVYLEAYPNAGKLLDLKALNLCRFEPGARVWNGRTECRVMDVFRRPGTIMESALAPLGTFGDKMRVALLRMRESRRTVQKIEDMPDLTSEEMLREFGFSESMIDGFFRAFYGGIFLEKELQTSAQMFSFTFKMFTEGAACVPAKGMEEIPRQLLGRLDQKRVWTGSRVREIGPDYVRLSGGEERRASKVVLATEGGQAQALLEEIGQKEEIETRWRATTHLSFAAEEAPLDNEPIIGLNGSGRGLVNNISVMSALSPDYAPEGKALISLSVLGIHKEPDLAEQVKKELEPWLGDSVKGWELLNIEVIRQALPEQRAWPEGRGLGHGAPCREVGGVLVCGDHVASASIDGAILSGVTAAEKISDAEREGSS